LAFTIETILKQILFGEFNIGSNFLLPELTARQATNIAKKIKEYPATLLI
jgi:hypothetical protein